MKHQLWIRLSFFAVVVLCLAGGVRAQGPVPHHHLRVSAIHDHILSGDGHGGKICIKREHRTSTQPGSSDGQYPRARPDIQHGATWCEMILHGSQA